jgi:hypothetical protein
MDKRKSGEELDGHSAKRRRSVSDQPLQYYGAPMKSARWEFFDFLSLRWAAGTRSGGWPKIHEPSFPRHSALDKDNKADSQKGQRQFNGRERRIDEESGFGLVGDIEEDNGQNVSVPKSLRQRLDHQSASYAGLT